VYKGIYFFGVRGARGFASAFGVAAFLRAGLAAGLTSATGATTGASCLVSAGFERPRNCAILDNILSFLC
jgi:hypothetical protein